METCPVLENQNYEKRGFSDKYDAIEGEELRLEKRYLAQEISDNFGPEHYMSIVSKLIAKCFNGINKENLSSHIMYRVVSGTLISEDEQQREFIFDDRDEAMEEVMEEIIQLDNVEEVYKVINNL